MIEKVKLLYERYDKTFPEEENTIQVKNFEEKKESKNCFGWYNEKYKTCYTSAKPYNTRNRKSEWFEWYEKCEH